MRCGVEEVLRTGLPIGRRQGEHPGEGLGHAFGEGAAVVKDEGDERSEERRSLWGGLLP